MKQKDKYEGILQTVRMAAPFIAPVRDELRTLLAEPDDGTLDPAVRQFAKGLSSTLDYLLKGF